mgnify:CR=1 FL=1
MIPRSWLAYWRRMAMLSCGVWLILSVLREVSR